MTEKSIDDILEEIESKAKAKFERMKKGYLNSLK